MTTATKPLPADPLSSRRAQPVRQTRINPPRSSALHARSFSGRDGAGGLAAGPGAGQPAEIFPAITHFADAITALPKEIVRHFTLLKEVDAKIFAPEEALAQLVEAVLATPTPQRPPPDGSTAAGASSHVASATASVNGSVVNGQDGAVASMGDRAEISNPADAVLDAGRIPRRHLIHQCAYSMQEMLLSLDEKNHVIATTTEAIYKQMSRLDECLPHIEHEVSDEARFGSETHWAYPENRAAKNSSDHRSRREAHASHAAPVVADDAAARSDARKQALLAKKARHHVDSDFDDGHDKNKGDKKAANKARRAEGSNSVGLGITNGSANANPQKRRKVEKAVAGAASDGLSASIMPLLAVKDKLGSPRETPLPDPRKRQRPATNGQGRKRYVGVRDPLIAIRNNTVTSVVMSPSLTSSPVPGTFGEPKLPARTSPGPPNGRPSGHRARQSSINSIVDKAPRPGSSASNKPNGNGIVPMEMSILSARVVPENKLVKEAGAEAEQGVEEAPADDVDGKPAPVSRKSSLKREEGEALAESIQTLQNANVNTITKSGRASKPSTPAAAQFPEPIRPRSSRETSSSKRKKSSIVHATVLSTGDDASTNPDDDDADLDADEPTYCYCNGVSYGEMVGCDADGCAREWFHLECVGLKTAPKGNAKWYCEDCKEIMKNKRFSARL